MLAVAHPETGGHATTNCVTPEDVKLREEAETHDHDSGRIARSLMEIYSLLPRQYSQIEAIQEDPVLILENTVEFIGELMNSQTREPICPTRRFFDISHDSQPGSGTASPGQGHCANVAENARAGFRDCSDEVIRFLVQSEHISENDPIVVGLREHLDLKEEELASSSESFDGRNEFFDIDQWNAFEHRNLGFDSTLVEGRCTPDLVNNTIQFLANPMCQPTPLNAFTRESMTSGFPKHSSELYQVTSELLSLLSHYDYDDVMRVDDQDDDDGDDDDDDDDVYRITESEQ